MLLFLPFLLENDVVYSILVVAEKFYFYYGKTW